jgi:hypothetical protein
MNYRLPLLICLLIVLLTGSFTPTRAQSGSPPLSLFLSMGTNGTPISGDLYSWDGGLRRRTNWGHNDIPIVSPDGRWVAYSSAADVYVKSPQQYGQVAVPINIWLLDPVTNKGQRIAGQPENASLETDNGAFVLRSQPSWSPSGRQLAWTEIEVDQSAGRNAELRDERLVAYDLDAKATRVLVAKLPDHRFSDVFPVLSEVAWGLPGIAVVTHATDPKDFPEQVTFYDTNGRQVSQTKPLKDTGFNYSQAIWVEGADGFYLTSIQGDLKIVPATGEVLGFEEGVPEAYSPLNPRGISMYYGDKTVGEGNPVWLLAYNGVVKTEMAASGRYYYLSGISISPDGNRAAYIIYPGQGTEGGLWVYRNGSKVRFDYGNVTGVSWGPIAWRIHYTPVNAG